MNMVAEMLISALLVIGGQMVFLHAIEQGATPPRVSTDLDVLVNARIAGRPLAADSARPTPQSKPVLP